MTNYLNLINQQVQIGHELFQEQRFEEALQELDQCFALAVQSGKPMLIDTYADIVLTMGFCFANLHGWDNALELYLHGVTIIKQEGNWFEDLPEGMAVGVPESFDKAVALATFYDSIALAYDNSDQPEQGRPYYAEAFKIYSSQGMDLRALQTLYFMGVGCQRFEDWARLTKVGERMLTVAQKTDPNGDMMVKSLQFLSQAHANRGDVKKAIVHLKQAVEIEKKTEHPDFKRDLALLREIVADYEEHNPPKKRFWN